MSKTVVAGLAAVVFAAGIGVGTVGIAQRAPASTAQRCGSAMPQLRTTMYFGLVRPKGGSVSELEWQLFLRDEVTARFPAGLTVWEAEGQWRGGDGIVGHERTKVLLLVHPDSSTAKEAVQTVMTRYRKMFEQESVLYESAEVCAAT